MATFDSLDREVSYDDLMELPYLDAVIRETMRLCVQSVSPWGLVGLFDNDCSVQLPWIHEQPSVRAFCHLTH